MIETKLPVSTSRVSLTQSQWEQRRDRHQQALAEVVDPYLEKRHHHEKDPVLDFLFEYYAFRPSHLKRWSPGLHVLLEGANRETAPDISELTISDDGAFLDPTLFPENRQSSARWVCSVLEASVENKPAFGCFGMHEWAMVYKADTVRHSNLPLRMEKEELAAFVESRPLVCTHFDAFRFFTKPAKPMNKFTPSRDAFQENEQAGCLHTNMDLYKWAFKLFPWISSEIVRRAFFFAVETRRIDMKASPYDVRDYGLSPIKIETEAGRKAYMRAQKEIYRRSIPIREQLIGEYRQLIATF